MAVRVSTMRSSQQSLLSQSIVARKPSTRTRRRVRIRRTTVQRGCAPHFFGRDDEITAIVNACREHYVVIVEGPAKIGKSSLITAGVLARLRSTSTKDGDWKANRLAYVDALQEQFEFPAWARRDASADLEQEATPPDVIVIDNLDPSTGRVTAWRERRLRPVDRVVAAAGPHLRVVLVWRGALPDDEYQRILEEWHDRNIARLFVEPLTGDSLRLAIEQPARVAGHLLENGLTERIVEGAGSARSAILQIQLTLEALWTDRRRGWLGNRSLDAHGHVSGLFRAHANRRLADLIHDPSALEAMFTALTDLNSSGDLTTRSLPWEQLKGVSNLERNGDALRDALANAGILDLWRAREEDTKGTSCFHRLRRFEPAEASLYFEAIGASPNVAFLAWRTKLASSMAAWNASNRSTDTLLIKQVLSDAQGWTRTHAGWLMEDEKALIDASLSARATRMTRSV
jgi:hypothetical protein